MEDHMDTPPAVGKDYEARYLVINGTSDPITRVSCIHACYDISWTNEASAPALIPGESSPVQILRAVVLRQDLWNVSFIRNGSMYASMTTARWDVPVGNAGGLCVVSLFASQFYVLPSQSWYKAFSYDLPFWPKATNPEEVSPHSPDDERCETSGQKKVYGVGVNEEIRGSFVVINATNGPITDVVVIHTCNGKDDTVNRPIMQEDEVSELKSLTSAAWSEDLWSVSFKTADGQTKSRQGKRCDYQKGDSPQVCLIILYPGDFSIADPVSDGCYYNHY